MLVFGIIPVQIHEVIGGMFGCFAGSGFAYLSGFSQKKHLAIMS